LVDQPPGQLEIAICAAAREADDAQVDGYRADTLASTMLAKPTCLASISGTAGRLEIDGWFYQPNTVRLVGLDDSEIARYGTPRRAGRDPRLSAAITGSSVGSFQAPGVQGGCGLPGLAISLIGEQRGIVWWGPPGPSPGLQEVGGVRSFDIDQRAALDD
jgi:hypothetical protein